VLAAPADRVIAATAPHPEATVEIAEGPTASWLDAFNQLDSHDESAAVGELVLSRIKAPAAYSRRLDRCREMASASNGPDGGRFSSAWRRMALACSSRAGDQDSRIPPDPQPLPPEREPEQQQ
jgi:hypothetical protein